MQRKRDAINLPVDAFTTCPSSRSFVYLRGIPFDVYRHSWGGTNAPAFVKAGGLDDLIYECGSHELAVSRDSRANKISAA